MNQFRLKPRFEIRKHLYKEMSAGCHAEVKRDSEYLWLSDMMLEIKIELQQVINANR